MIHDPELEVTCDGEDCVESMFYPMNWTTGGYDLRGDDLKDMLNADGWGVKGDEHYCEDCWNDMNGPNDEFDMDDMDGGEWIHDSDMGAK